MAKIPFILGSNTGRSTNINAQRTVNMFPATGTAVYVNGAFYTFTEWDALGVKDQNSLGAAPTFGLLLLERGHNQ